jgi:hypothetical protein
VTVTRAQVATQTTPDFVLSPVFDTLPAGIQQQHLWIARRGQLTAQRGALPPADDPATFRWVVELWRTLTGDTITSIYGVPTPTAPVIPAAPQVITAAVTPTAIALQPAPTPVAPEVSAAVNTPAASSSPAIPADLLAKAKEWLDGETFGIPNKFLAVGAVLVGAALFMGGNGAPAPARRGRR